MSGLIFNGNTTLVLVQEGLKKAIKATGAKQGDGVELADLAREFRKCEKAINTQSNTGLVAGNPLLDEVEKTLLTSFNAASAANDNAALVALSKEIRQYEKELNKPAKTANKPTDKPAL